MEDHKPAASKNKRKREWDDVQDAFSGGKKQRTGPSSTSQKTSKMDFSQPTFDHSSKERKARAVPGQSLHSGMKDFALPFKDDKKPKISQATTVHPLISTPKPPPSISEHLKEPPTSTKKLTPLFSVPVPKLTTQTDSHAPKSMQKTMQSVLKTPLIPAAFGAPSSQTLDVPLVDIFDDASPKKTSPLEAALGRGLEQSPEKANRGSKSFIRGGLAERARIMMERATTELSLWHEDMVHSHQSTEPNLRLRISEIISRNPPGITQLESTAVSSSKPSTLTSILARCSRLDISSEQQEMMVLFSSSVANEHSKRSRKKVADIHTLQVGREIHLWQPWSEVKISWPQESDSASKSVILCARFMAK